MAPRDVCILVPRTCEYVILYGKKGDFAGCDEGSWDVDSVFDYSGGPNVITRVHTRGKKKGQECQNQREGVCEQKSEWCAQKMKEGDMSQEVQPPGAGKVKGRDTP